MLVLSRKTTESILIGDNIEVRVIEVRGGRVRLGIVAPVDVPVHRSEVAARMAEFLVEIDDVQAEDAEPVAVTAAGVPQLPR